MTTTLSGEPAPIAVMGYTVLRQATADLEGTLARVADLGFLGIETYGLVEQFGGERVRRAIDAAGLRLTSAHTPFPAGLDAERVLDDASALGADSLVWSMERNEFDSVDAIARGVARVNEGAENAATRGMTVVYHNHFAEFSQSFGDRSAFEILIDLLDDRVLLELDAYWARMGGADVPDLLSSFGDRMRWIHIKDGPAVSYDHDIMVPIGDGEVDWHPALLASSGLRWHIVELERLNLDTFEALERSYDYLVGQGLSTGSRAVTAPSEGGL
jgi:sugar phosphate isomerase/epimerase